MTPPRLDELLALVRDLGTEENFPEQDELYGLLEPFRAIADQESVQLALAAAVRKSERLRARVAAQALAYLGGDEAGPLLVGIVADEALPLARRAAAAWSIGSLLPEFSATLAADEQFACASVPMLEMLDDPEADNGFGLEAFLGSYQAFAPENRLDFVEKIIEFARAHDRPMATLCMHLLNSETDPARRRRLLELAASDQSKEAADLIAAFAQRSGRSAEAKEARRLLEILGSKGLRGEIQPDFEAARAFLTGVDGDACLSFTLLIPRSPTFDVVSLLLHLSTGIRDGFVLRNIPRRDADDLVDRVRQESDNLATFVPLPLAARIADEALALAPPDTLLKPEIAEAIETTRPVFERARKQPFPEPPLPTGADAILTADEIRGLLDSNGFEYWFFEAGEAALRPSLVALRKPVGSEEPKATLTLKRRLEKEALRVCARFIADGEPERLGRMLLHQARLLDCVKDEARARLCRRAAVDVKRPGSAFLLHMAIRSLLRGLETPELGENMSRFLDARLHLRDRARARTQAPSKEDVIGLDLAAAAFVTLNTINREAPSARRAPLNLVETAASDMGAKMAVTLLTRRKGESPDELFAEMKTILDDHALFPAAEREAAALATIESLVEFVDEICGHCPHGCLERAGDDGRSVYYADEPPWQVAEGALLRRRPSRGRED
jgi:hypothetical protein